jgi:hypothetical protein
MPGFFLAPLFGVFANSRMAAAFVFPLISHAVGLLSPSEMPPPPLRSD